jgi:hypothetical protein
MLILHFIEFQLALMLSLQRILAYGKPCERLSISKWTNAISKSMTVTETNVRVSGNDSQRTHES